MYAGGAQKSEARSNEHNSGLNIDLTSAGADAYRVKAGGVATKVATAADESVRKNHSKAGVGKGVLS